MKLSLTQRIVRFFTSKSLFEKIKADSLLYEFDCDCGKKSNIWEIGGVKYKASDGSKTGIRCPQCRKFSMRKIVKRKSGID